MYTLKSKVIFTSKFNNSTAFFSKLENMFWLWPYLPYTYLICSSNFTILQFFKIIKITVLENWKFLIFLSPKYISVNVGIYDCFTLGIWVMPNCNCNRSKLYDFSSCSKKDYLEFKYELHYSTLRSIFTVSKSTTDLASVEVKGYNPIYLLPEFLSSE